MMNIKQSPRLALELAYAAGKDSGNRAMEQTGKNGKPWTRKAYRAAVKERNRIMDELYPGEER
jgi:hypothetical protein